MKRYMVDFSITLSGDNYSSFGVFYLNGSDIIEVLDKITVVKDNYLASCDNFEIISIKLV